MDNSVEMKIDWAKIPEYVDFVTVNDDGDVGCYYHNDHMLMFITNTRVHMVSVFKSIDEVRMFCKKVIERPIAYPNPLMKYIGCEVVYSNYNMDGFEDNYSGFVIDVIEDLLVFGVECFGVIHIDKNNTSCVYLVNEDGSLVQLGKEDWQ